MKPMYKRVLLKLSGEALSGEGRHQDGDHTSHSAAFFCDTPAAERGGPALHPGDDGTCGYLFDSNLHTSGKSAFDGCLSQEPSQSVKGIMLQKTSGICTMSEVFIVCFAQKRYLSLG